MDGKRGRGEEGEGGLHFDKRTSNSISLSNLPDWVALVGTILG